MPTNPNSHPLRGQLLALFAAAACLYALGTQAQSATTYRVVGVAADDVLNIRSEPDASSDDNIVDEIPPNATGIIQIGPCDAWCNIRYGETEGWVNSSFLQVQGTTRRAEAAKASIGMAAIRYSQHICTTVVRDGIDAGSDSALRVLQTNLTAECQKCFATGLKQQLNQADLAQLDAVLQEQVEAMVGDIDSARAKFATIFAGCSESLIAKADETLKSR